jgi:hypothetical protein
MGEKISLASSKKLKNNCAKAALEEILSFEIIISN